MKELEGLEDIGFRRVGAWRLASERAVFALESDESSRDVLYAFVSGREVLYVGKTVQALRARMRGYQRPGPTQRTNIKVRAAITKHLGSDRALDIWALCDRGTLHRGVFVISLAAGLEDAIIRKLRPPWNKVGK